MLKATGILNDVDRLNSVMERSDEDPEVVLEATYGWYWAVDALRAADANVHLAHPLGVKAFEYRRVKNDVRDATDLADDRSRRAGRRRRPGRYRRNDSETDVANRETWTVVDGERGELTVVGEAGRRVLPAAYVREHVELAYATTAYGAQGSTVSAAHVLVGVPTAGLAKPSTPSSAKAGGVVRSFRGHRGVSQSAATCGPLRCDAPAAAGDMGS